jgi:Asp/Glu/hydantoin racemase
MRRIIMNKEKTILYLNHSKPGSYWWGEFLRYIKRFPDVEMRPISEDPGPFPTSVEELTVEFLKKEMDSSLERDFFGGMEKAEREGYGAAFTASSGDFGFMEARQRLSIPCIGMGWANFKKAIELGGRFSILHNHGPATLPYTAHLAERYGFSGNVVSIEEFKVDVYALAAREEKADLGQWMEVAMPLVQKCIEKGAKAFVIPCGSPDLSEFAAELNKVTMEKYGIPVLPPIDTVVNVAREFIQKKREMKELRGG